MIHVYAFAAGLERLPDLAGVDGARIEELRLGDVSAVVSRHESPPEGEPAAAVAHGLVVEALLDVAAAVLPVRFGEAASEEALADAVPRMESALAHVRGCVEFAASVSSPEPALVVADTGTDYLRRRLAEQTVAGELRAALEPVARDVRDTAYLVPRDRTLDARAAIERFAAAHPDVTVLWSGPWAPYSFAEAA